MRKNKVSLKSPSAEQVGTILSLRFYSCSNAEAKDDGRENPSPYDAPQRTTPSGRARSSEKCVRCLPCAPKYTLGIDPKATGRDDRCRLGKPE